MDYWTFRNTGVSVLNPAVQLGVMPRGELLNAMELVFHEDEAARRRREALVRGAYGTYRCRQTIEEHSFQFVNGRWFRWTSAPAGTPDDPDEGVYRWTPPYIRVIDTPGWSAWEGVNSNTRQLTAPNGVPSAWNATEVWVQHEMRSWVEGETIYFQDWEEVSARVVWHNSLHLIRSSPTSAWTAGSDCRIHHGPMRFGSAALL
jgi:hypothetical protein